MKREKEKRFNPLVAKELLEAYRLKCLDGAQRVVFQSRGLRHAQEAVSANLGWGFFALPASVRYNFPVGQDVVVRLDWSQKLGCFLAHPTGEDVGQFLKTGAILVETRLRSREVLTRSGRRRVQHTAVHPSGKIIVVDGQPPEGEVFLIECKELPGQTFLKGRFLVKREKSEEGTVIGVVATEEAVEEIEGPPKLDHEELAVEFLSSPQRLVYGGKRLTPYEILDVNRYASRVEIKKAYRARAVSLGEGHPDLVSLNLAREYAMVVHQVVAGDMVELGQIIREKLALPSGLSPGEGTPGAVREAMPKAPPPEQPPAQGKKDKIAVRRKEGTRLRAEDFRGKMFGRSVNSVLTQLAAAGVKDYGSLANQKPASLVGGSLNLTRAKAYVERAKALLAGIG